LYLELDMKLTKFHRVLDLQNLQQSPWLTEYIDFKTEKRKHVANDFEKDFFKLLLAVFTLKTHYPSGRTWENIWSSSGYASHKTATRRIIRLDELSLVMRIERRTSKDSSSIRIMLVPVFILGTHNQTNSKCLPKFVQTENASSSIKTAIKLL